MLNLREDYLSINLNETSMNLKSKIEARHEAARLALAVDPENFTKKATEIYNFFTDGIALPDTYDESSSQRDMLESLRLICEKKNGGGSNGE